MSVLSGEQPFVSGGGGGWVSFVCILTYLTVFTTISFENISLTYAIIVVNKINANSTVIAWSARAFIDI